MADEYFCGLCNSYRQANTDGKKCEKCGRPTVTVGYSKPGKKETPQELRDRWNKLYGGYR
jgi:hypothetical protein